MRITLQLLWTATFLALVPAIVATQSRQGQVESGLVLPEIAGPKPWSEKPILDDPSRFHIAIMTDRTGGHRPGVWMKAVRHLNRMRPEFVMSVGDLIEGYSTDKPRLEAEWKEFLGFIDRLDMKFFFVAGNHDVTNPLLHRMWRERFGREWYSFDYKGVHFLCLCSEDPRTKIGAEQLQWIEQDLAKSRNARWTLVFLHKPLWVTAERALAAGDRDPTNWKKVEAKLGDRKHTVFAGHVHHYVQYDRRGSKYYHLATTGGGSRQRGKSYGEFDHVTWLTMEKDGPRVANLLLDGILPADAVTEKSIARFRAFLAKSMIEIAPILLDGKDRVDSGTIRLRLTNAFDAKIKLSGAIEGLPLRGLTLDPHKLEITAAPGESKLREIRFELGKALEMRHFAQTVLTAKLVSVEDKPLRAELQLPVLIDRKFLCPTATIAIDGDLDEWGALGHAFREDSLVLGASEQWQGLADASARFSLKHDADHLYLGAHVLDDSRTSRDRIVLTIDSRPIAVRIRDPRLNRGTFRIEITPSEDGDGTVRVRRNRGNGEEIRAIVKCKPTRGGYFVEAAIPLAVLRNGQGAVAPDFQFTIALQDLDEPKEKDCWVVWRGSANLRSRNTNFAHFFRK